VGSRTKKIPILESQATTRGKDVEGELTGTEKIADNEKLSTLQRVEKLLGRSHAQHLTSLIFSQAP